MDGNDTGDEVRLLDATHVMARFSTEVTQTVDAALGTEGATNSDMRFACELHRSRVVTLDRCMELSGFDRRGAARHGKQFESLGLIARMPDPRDGRSNVFKASRVGLARLRRLETYVGEYFAHCTPLAKDLIDLLEPASDSPRARVRPTEPRPTALDVLDRMAAVGNRLSAAIVAKRPDAVYTGREHIALIAVLNQGDIRAGALAEQLGLTSGGLTYVVKQLEAKDMVERTFGRLDSDRRAVSIELTPYGRAVALDTMSAIDDLSEDLVGVFRAIRDFGSTP